MSEADVTVCEAKARLSELLRETERGRSFVIRRRGKPVARLVPFAQDRLTADFKRTLNAFREIRSRLSGREQGRPFLDEGRRFLWTSWSIARSPRPGGSPTSPRPGAVGR